MVLKYQMGDRLALESLFLRHHRQVHYYLRRLLGNDDVASDVQQEVWLQVVRRLVTLRQPESFAVWLYRIVRNKAFSRLRDKFCSQSIDYSGELPEESTTGNGDFSPDDAAAIHAGLNELSPEHREVLVLRFMENLSYEEMAEVTGSGIGTIRSRLHYAKKTMRTFLEKTYGR